MNTSSTDLTQKQRKVLTFIQRHIENKGYPPSTREIQVHFGFSSQTAVTNHLAALTRKGVLKRIPNIARGIVLTPAV